MTNNTLVTQLEQIAMNAWPAYKTQVYDGWILRFTNGVTRRSNSINPLFTGINSVEEKIDYCESVYATQALPATYKMTQAVFPSNLDSILEVRGYIKYAETSFQCANLQELAFNDANIISSSKLSTEWLKNSLDLNEYSQDLFNDYKIIFDSIINDSLFIEIHLNGKAIASALAVREGDYIGLFDIVVDKNYRKQGLATRMLSYLFNWGINQGAKKAYLQVLANNASALELYKKLGFKELYPYWYRVKPISF